MVRPQPDAGIPLVVAASGMTPPRPISVPARITSCGILVPVRLTPGAGHDRINGVKDDGAGTRQLAVSVTAAPRDGKANAALIGLLAKAWRLPKSAISIAAGAKARTKLVRVAGDPADILKRIKKHGFHK